MNKRQAFGEIRRLNWDHISRQNKKFSGFSDAYHARLNRIFQANVVPNSRVLEIGCGEGDLLSCLKPAYGLGVDFSQSVIDKARKRNPDMQFQCLDAHDLNLINEQFDYIIMSDLINDLYDVECVLNQVSHLCHQNTRILINYYSHLWAGILGIAQKLQLANKHLKQNWFTRLDLENLLGLADFQPIKNQEEIIFPAPIPFLSETINRFVPKLWPFNQLALTNFMVARYLGRNNEISFNDISIVVPARNEAGHIEELVDRIPFMGAKTEVIFVEGGSTDDTYESIKQAQGRRTDIEISHYQQSGKGKADAVRLGFEKAKYSLLMILDADISVMPEDLPRFHKAISEGHGELINGVRLVYPMEDHAMRFLNLVGNKFFSWGFRFALGQPIKDTLCGTKVISRENYDKIVNQRHYFGDFDPYGDYDLIFGAAKLNLKIIDMPVRYQARTYGETNINRWTGGVLLFKMLIKSLVKIKFT